MRRVRTSIMVHYEQPVSPCHRSCARSKGRAPQPQQAVAKEAGRSLRESHLRRQPRPYCACPLTTPPRTRGVGRYASHVI